jgi:hypothetical protein
VTKNRLLAGLAGLMLGMCSLSAGAAKGLTYSYGEIGYTNLDSDEVDGEGATARASFGATDYIHLKFEWTHFENLNVTRRHFFGKKTLDVRTDRFLVGAGGNYTVLEKASLFDAIDVFGTASFYNAANSKDNNNTDRGYQLDGGLRALLSKKFELNATATYLHVDNFTGETGFGAGAVYKFYKKYSVAANVRHFSQDDTTEFFAGLRVNF